MLDRCWLQRQVLQVFSYKLWEKSKAEVCMCVCTRACVRVSTCACVCVYVFYVIAKTSKYSRISHSQIETILENHHLKFSDKGSSPRQSPVPRRYVCAHCQHASHLATQSGNVIDIYVSACRHVPFLHIPP